MSAYILDHIRYFVEAGTYTHLLALAAWLRLGRKRGSWLSEFTIRIKEGDNVSIETWRLFLESSVPASGRMEAEAGPARFQ
jgi:hypothetical protein